MSSASIKQSENDKGRDRRAFGPGGRRFLIFALLVLVMLAAILIQTASLQLSETQGIAVIESSGEQRQMVIPAARGDIVDANGIPLAYSEKTRALYLADASLDTQRLNRMLLDLALLLEEDGILYSGNLTSYLDLSSAAKEGGDVSFVFKREADAIRRWQKNRDLFNLLDEEEATTEARRKRMVRLDPEVLFDYLLYDFFEIESRSAGGSRLYTDREAFRIMELRYTLLENNWLYRTGNPIRIADDVSHRLEQTVNDQPFRYPGVILEDNYQRRYSELADYAGHAIGYVGAISGDEYEELQDFGYQLNSVTGKSGIELSAERYLKGTDGLRTYLLFVDNETQTTSDGGRQPQSGAEVRLTLDARLQKVAQQALSDSMADIRDLDLEKAVLAPSGSFVVLNPQTGGVYAIGGQPDYKVADFVNQAVDPGAAERVQNYLTDTATKPMLNRAMSENYVPGSTFKPFTSIAGLESGAISIYDNSFVCNGHEEIGGWDWKCLQRPLTGHGSLTLAEGLTTSCNLYFYQLGMETGIDNISAYAKLFGLGELSGIDLPGEVQGIRPSREMKALLRYLPEDKIWFQADTCQTSIGQFDNSYTMLQMARGIAALSTGYLTRPHVIEQIVDVNGVVVREEQIERQPLGLDPDNIAAVRAGMVGLTTVGNGRTAELFHDFPVTVAAKTGTAEVGYGENKTTNAVFICFAPAEDPIIAMAYTIEDASYGDLISDIAYRILCEFFEVTPKDIPKITPLATSTG